MDDYDTRILTVHYCTYLLDILHFVAVGDIKSKLLFSDVRKAVLNGHSHVAVILFVGNTL